MAVPYKHPRGTRAALTALAAANQLVVGQVYVLTDEQRLAVALTTSTFETFAKESEAGGGGGGSPSGPMSTYIDQPTGTVSVTTTAEVELASVAIPAGAANRKLLILANANFTKDTGTTVRATTMRLRQGTDNSGTLLKSASSAAANVASIPFGTATIAFLHEPGAGATNYRISGVNFASSTITANNISIQVIDLTNATEAEAVDIHALTGGGVITPRVLGEAVLPDTVSGVGGFIPPWSEFITGAVVSNEDIAAFEFYNPIGALPGTSRVVYLALIADVDSRVVVWGDDYINVPAITVAASESVVYRIVLEATPFEKGLSGRPYIYVSATLLSVDI